jgi:hypothetical protein
MKSESMLGCLDNICNCGCPDCSDIKDRVTDSVKSVVAPASVLPEGYRRPVSEDYLSPEDMVRYRSGYHKKGNAADVHTPSGYNKKKIVQVPSKQNNSLNNGGDLYITIISGIGLLILLNIMNSGRSK